MKYNLFCKRHEVGGDGSAGLMGEIGGGSMENYSDGLVEGGSGNYSSKGVSRKGRLRAGLVGVMLVGVLGVGSGCGAIYEDPVVGGALSILPRRIQPGGYRDVKEREVREEERKFREENTIINERGRGSIFEPGDVYVTSKGQHWVKLDNGYWKHDGGAIAVEREIIRYSNNSNKSIFRNVDGEWVPVY
jgi:hypothetical protein